MTKEERETMLIFLECIDKNFQQRISEIVDILKYSQASIHLSECVKKFIQNANEERNEHIRNAVREILGIELAENETRLIWCIERDEQASRLDLKKTLANIDNLERAFQAWKKIQESEMGQLKTGERSGNHEKSRDH